MTPASVAIVGVGGLGCPASLALARLGVKALTLIDPDVVDVSNLHRQPWHHPADVGRPKVASAAEKLRRQFPSLHVEGRCERLTAASAEAVFRAHDLVLDATDGVSTKFLLSDASVLTGTPAVYGGVLRFEGLAMRLERHGPCLRCLFESPPADVPTCAEAGVLGAMAGVVGGLQATLACAPSPEAGVGLLHVIDGRELTFRVVKVRRRPDCAACGDGARAVLVDPEEGSCSVPASTSPARSAR
ncbi:MAG: HesA/MoeB/ThiF family protein [Myxococcaceae bacterium]|nr:HesA/MoeB/ThiF family protein [Myxococcaceae bacterium]